MHFQTVISAARAAALVAALSCLAVTTSLPAGAQTMAQPKQNAKAQPNQNAQAPAPADDPARVAAAREFLITYHPRMDPKALVAMLDKFRPRMLATAKAADPKADANKVVDERRKSFITNLTRSLDMQSRIIARHFTVQELKGLTAFFRGPLGKKLVEETPKIQMEVMRQHRINRPIPPGATVIDMSKKQNQSPREAEPKKK